MNSRSGKIIYWIATLLIVLFDGLLPALTSNSRIAADAIRHLGYPDYFRTMLTVFKVAGALVLVVPFAKRRFKEWAYAGFGITFISATVSNWVTDGFTGITLLPIFAFALLVVSYLFYYRLYLK